MIEFKVKNEVSSFLPDVGKEWKMTFSDEFNGTELDKSKWSFRKHLFHKPHPGWLEEEGIELRDGNVVFKLIEKDGKYYSTQLQTGENWYDRPSDNEGWNIAPFSTPKFEQKFGYYEVRCKLQKGDWWWSSFWLQSPNIGTHRDPKKAGVEVDILEAFFGQSYIPHFIHWGGYSENHEFECTMDEHRYAKNGDETRVDDGYHTFGCLWEEDGYTFFVDGVQSGRKLKNAVSHTEEFILLGTEVVGYRGNIPGVYRGADKLARVENDEFVVDYVRVFSFE